MAFQKMRKKQLRTTYDKEIYQKTKHGFGMMPAQFPGYRR